MRYGFKFYDYRSGKYQNNYFTDEIQLLINKSRYAQRLFNVKHIMEDKLIVLNLTVDVIRKKIYDTDNRIEYGYVEEYDIGIYEVDENTDQIEYRELWTMLGLKYEEYIYIHLHLEYVNCEYEEVLEKRKRPIFFFMDNYGSIRKLTIYTYEQLNNNYIPRVYGNFETEYIEELPEIELEFKPKTGVSSLFPAIDDYEDDYKCQFFEIKKHGDKHVYDSEGSYKVYEENFMCIEKDIKKVNYCTII